MPRCGRQQGKQNDGSKFILFLLIAQVESAAI